MAIALKKREGPRQVITRIRRVFFGPHPKYGPQRTWQPGSDVADEVAAYRAAARTIRRRSKAWKSRRLWTDAQGLPSDNEMIVCEHCLTMNTVVLVIPGIISQHESGDWVCYACDPDVAGEYIMKVELEALVLEESS